MECWITDFMNWLDKKRTTLPFVGIQIYTKINNAQLIIIVEKEFIELNVYIKQRRHVIFKYKEGKWTFYKQPNKIYDLIKFNLNHIKEIFDYVYRES